MADMPAISVVMPVFNAEAFVRESIQSILDQTFRDFEFIIVNDGSTDGSEQVVHSFSDPRIRYVAQQNQGIARSLNNGISLARAPLIARQDADDVSLPERLSKQVTFLAQQPDVGLVGTWAEVINADGSHKGVLEHPLVHGAIEFELLFNSPFVHPSVMFRKELLDVVGVYDGDPMIFEDMDLWSRMLRHTKGANLPEHLVRYRDVATGLSNSTPIAKERLRASRRRNLRYYFHNVGAGEEEVVTAIGNDHPLITTGELINAQMLLTRFVNKVAPASPLNSSLRVRLRARLMSYRIVQHHSLVHRFIDRVWKTVTLELGTLRLSKP